MLYAAVGFKLLLIGGALVERYAPVIPWLVLSALAGGCAGAKGPPKFSPGESDCLLTVEAEHASRLISCGTNVLGNCSTDALMDRKQEEGERCLDRY